MFARFFPFPTLLCQHCLLKTNCYKTIPCFGFYTTVLTVSYLSFSFLFLSGFASSNEKGYTWVFKNLINHYVEPILINKKLRTISTKDVILEVREISSLNWQIVLALIRSLLFYIFTMDTKSPICCEYQTDTSI